MKSNITVDRIANSIRMHNDSKKLHLVVEGKVDYKVYPYFFDNKQLITHCASGYEAILEVFNKVTETNSLGFIDADFRRIDDSEVDDERVIMTDSHDLEVMIIDSDAIDKLENLFIPNKKKIKEVFGSKALIEHITVQGKTLGILRYMNYSTKDGFGLRFKELNYSRMITNNDKKIIDLVIDCSKRLNSSCVFNKEKIEKIYKEFEKISSQKFEEGQLLNGHDLVNLLMFSINKVLRKCSSKIKFVNEEHLINTLCLSYISSNEFKNTKMFQEVSTYLQKNNLKSLLI